MFLLHVSITARVIIIHVKEAGQNRLLKLMLKSLYLPCKLFYMKIRIFSLRCRSQTIIEFWTKLNAKEKANKNTVILDSIFRYGSIKNGIKCTSGHSRTYLSDSERILKILSS